MVTAAALSRFMATLLYGVKSAEPDHLWGGRCGVGLVAIIATYIPARRAAAGDPVEALRLE